MFGLCGIARLQGGRFGVAGVPGARREVRACADSAGRGVGLSSCAANRRLASIGGAGSRPSGPAETPPQTAWKTGHTEPLPSPPGVLLASDFAPRGLPNRPWDQATQETGPIPTMGVAERALLGRLHGNAPPCHGLRLSKPQSTRRGVSYCQNLKTASSWSKALHAARANGPRGSCR